MEQREQQIIRVSLIGIITNVVLAAFKFVVGFLANSVAIVLYVAIRQQGFAGLEKQGNLHELNWDM